MTVGELIAELDDVDPGTEVRIASQPRWPFEYSIQGVYLVEGKDAPDEDESEPETSESIPEAVETAEQPPVIYLAEGSQLGYLPRPARSVIGW